jgi:hypothetical protein
MVRALIETVALPLVEELAQIDLSHLLTTSSDVFNI